MRLSILIAISAGILYTSCTKKNEDNRPLLINEYDYSVTLASDRIAKIVTKDDNNNILDQEHISKLNDTTYLSILSDTYTETLQKKYYYLNSENLAYRSVDSVKANSISSTVLFTYNEDDFLLKTEINANVADVDMDVHTVTTNTVENENIVRTEILKTITGSDNFTEKEILQYYFTTKENKEGIQFLSQKFLGKANKYLVDSIRYSYYKNDVLIKSGKYTYTYTIDIDTKRVLKENEYYRADNPNYNDVQTIRRYTYFFQ